MSIAAYTKPVEKTVGKTNVRLIRDDLTAMELDAFVYYAREDLEIGSGYGTAIQMRAGLAVKKELAEVGGIKMGQAIISGSGEMNCKHIIHACGPKFLEENLEGKLRECMMSALEVASKEGLKTIGFPPMGAGFYGIPLPMCTDVILECIKAHAKSGTSLEEINIVTVDSRDFAAFSDKVKNL